MPYDKKKAKKKCPKCGKTSSRSCKLKTCGYKG